MSTITWNDVKEGARTYHFPKNEQVTFPNVRRVGIGGSCHRIETADGKKAIVSPGWLWIEIAGDWVF